MSESEVKGSKKNILDCAAKLFSKLGIDKCSTRDIAKKSDSNISLISYYFGGKEGLYKEVLRSHALEVKATMESVVQRSQTQPLSKSEFVEQVDQMVANLINFRLQYPEVAKIFAREKLSGMPYAKDVHEEIFYPLIQSFFAIFKNGQKLGYVRTEINPALFFIALSEGIWGTYQVLDCEIPLRQDCEDILKDPELFKKQILQIYLTGVLV